METIDVDVVVLPEQTIADRAYQLSRALQRYPNELLLSEGVCFAHVSVYMPRLRTADLPRVGEILAGIARRVPQLTLASQDYHYSEGYFDVGYGRTGAIERLQAEVIAALNPLRAAERESGHTLTPAEEQNLQQYGYPYVSANFRPHLTFTWFKDSAQVVEGLPPAADFSGAFPELGLFERGPKGTCIRQLGVWPLAPIIAA